ncbi:MAG TPA: hypothetical protein VF177_18870 [Anaerolineae bacterium]
MFEVNGVYANRRGQYTVLEVNAPRMRVRYEDGTEAELNMDIQARIWENIAAEQEARASRSSARAARRGASVLEAQHFIKVVSIPAVDEFTFPGWPEQVVMAKLPEQAAQIKAGDRLIFYAVEPRMFFAVATITGSAFEADPKEYFFMMNADSMLFFPIDIDAVSSSLEKGVDIDSVELESQPNFRRLRLEPEAFLPINEDDFELLAELLTEVAEEEEEEEGEDEYEEEEED